MELCSLCCVLDVRNFLDEDYEVQTVFHHESLEDLQQSAKTCPLCHLFYKELTFSEKYPGPEQPTSKYKTAVLLRAGQDVDYDNPPKSIYTLRVRCGDEASARFGLYVDEDCPIVVPQELVTGKAIKPPEHRFDLLEDWIEKCDSSHDGCRPQSTKLPTRVIDVGKATIQEPYLKLTGGEESRYIALSHCWGKKPLIRTTKATFPDHVKQMPITSLPKTFQDAIAITRKLGVQYLWIDSLCIIQDDSADWEQEAASMGEYYLRSYLTIAATASADSSGGCFQPRTTSTHVRLKYTINKGEVGYVFIRERPRGFQDLPDSILNRRAWVTQERLLSPRIIHYDADQLLWECRQTQYTEDGVPVGAYGTQGNQQWDGRFRLEYADLLNPHDFAWDWYEMLNHYTRCGLTKLSDKLPAVSGLASVIGSRSGENYVAGLWESHLNVGLLWKRQISDPWLLKIEPQGAPSWSWAAYDGPITTPDRYWVLGSPSLELVASNIRQRVVAAGLDPDGQLVSGSLCITARLKKADPRVDPDSEGYTKYLETGGHDYLKDGGESIGYVNFDQAYDGDKTALYCLQMTRKQYIRRQICHVLVLKKTGKENNFERVGAGLTGSESWIESLGSTWFEDAKVSEIVIA